MLTTIESSELILAYSLFTLQTYTVYFYYCETSIINCYNLTVRESILLKALGLSGKNTKRVHKSS